MNRENCANEGKMGSHKELWNEARCWYQPPRSPCPVLHISLLKLRNENTDIFLQASRSVAELLLGGLTSVQDLTRLMSKE
jgi:hypothetical protein